MEDQISRSLVPAEQLTLNEALLIGGNLNE